jgi:hypothetical protein
MQDWREHLAFGVQETLCFLHSLRFIYQNARADRVCERASARAFNRGHMT